MIKQSIRDLHDKLGLIINNGQFRGTDFFLKKGFKG